MKIFIILGSIFFMLFILFYYLTRYYLKQIISRPVKDCRILYEKECNKGLINNKFYEGLKKQQVSIVTKDGLTLKGVYIKGTSDMGKTMIFVHGITVAIPTSIKYAKMFIDRGWNVLMYDQRRHGKSEGSYSTFGYFEKQDLDLWVEWIVKNNGTQEIIGLHGESMGAATVLEYGNINKYVKFIIADCAYSDMNELMKYRMKHDTIYPTFPLIQLASLRASRLAKFRFSDVSPINAIKCSDVSVLFIHGDEDKFVPTFMSEEMYKVKKGMKKIYIAKGAAHAESFAVDKERYEKEVFEFVDEALENKTRGC